MYSGKTTKLNGELIRFSFASCYKSKIVKIIHSSDVRIDTYSDEFGSTHNPSYKSIKDIDVIRTSKLKDLNLDNYEIIGIDEAQFFEDLLVVKDWNKTVFVSGLDGDSHKRKFGHILDLIPYCDTIVKLCAICQNCSSKGKMVDAPFTIKLDGKSDQIDVDGKYIPVCRSCSEHK
jgi:thymidine kinase